MQHSAKFLIDIDNVESESDEEESADSEKSYSLQSNEAIAV